MSAVAGTDSTAAESSRSLAFDALDEIRIRAEARKVRERRSVVRSLDRRHVATDVDASLSAGALPPPMVRFRAPEADITGLVEDLRNRCGDQPFAEIGARSPAKSAESPEELYKLIEKVKVQFEESASVHDTLANDDRWRATFERLFRRKRGPYPLAFPRFDSLAPLLSGGKVPEEETGVDGDHDAADSGGARTGGGTNANGERSGTPDSGDSGGRPFGLAPYGLESALGLIRGLDPPSDAWAGFLDFYRTYVFKALRAPFSVIDARILTPLGTAVNAAAVVFLGAGVSNAPVVGLLEPIASAGLLLLLLLYHLLAYLSWERPWSGFRWLATQPYLREDSLNQGLTEPDKMDPALQQHHRTVFNIVNRIRALKDPTSSKAQMTDPKTEELRKLIVNAFLHDLFRAYRRHPFLRKNDRTHYPVLAVRLSPSTGKPSRDSLVERIERIRRKTLWPDPLLIAEFAVGDRAGPDPPACTPSASQGLTAAFDEWKEDRRERGRLGKRVLDGGFVTLPKPVGCKPRQAPRLWVDTAPWRAAQLLLWTAAAASVLLLTGYVVVAAGQSSSPCWLGQRAVHPGVERIGDDCVGLTDGSFPFHPRLASIEERIAEQNAAVLDSGDPYVDVVYFGALSVDDEEEQSDLLAGVHGELAGLAVEQREYNERAGRQGYARVRLLPVNAGPKLRHAKAVAHLVAEEAADNPRLVAAVGFGQSRQATRDAIAVLTQAGLPMVGTTPTYDDIGLIQEDGKRSSFFFPIAPANSRIASQAARWARSGSPRTGSNAGYRLEAADTAVGLASAAKGELYGVDLAETFMREFITRGGGTTAEGREAEAGVLRYTDPESLKDRISEICRNAPDLIYYGGRSDEFGTVFDDLQKSTGCADGVTIVGSDDIAKYVTDHVADLGAVSDDFPVYYTPLAASGTWGLGGDKGEKGFYADFTRLGEDLGWSAGERQAPSVAHAVMAFDALSVTAQAVSDAQDMQASGRSSPKPLPETIMPTLSQVTGVSGVSGLIEFDGIGPKGNWIPDRMVQLVRAGPEGSQHPVAVCGRVTSKDSREGAVCG